MIYTMKISVIIPTYNSSKFIRKTLESVKDQQVMLQIIVIDDCSIDNTLEIVNEVLRYTDHIIITNKFHTGGPNRGRNEGLRFVTGKYIAFCDHDDIWQPGKCLSQLQLMISTKSKICTVGQMNIENNKQRIKIGPKNIYAQNETFLKLLAKDYRHIQNCTFSGIMIHNTLKRYKFEELYGMYEDPWLIKIFEGQKSCEVRLPLVEKRMIGKNLSASQEFINNFKLENDLLKKYSFIYPNQFKKRIKNCNERLARYYYFMGNYKKSRDYFKKSKKNLINFWYYLSSFVCPEIVKRFIHVWG